jgi:hypothetical protein
MWGLPIEDRCCSAGVDLHNSASPCLLQVEGIVTLPSGNARCYRSCISKNAYRGHRFPQAINQMTVWMYARFMLGPRGAAKKDRVLELTAAA